ncbi:MAG: hypothetical protein R3E73_10890 [Porticoccaceae bacterium]|nr:hypothetical protein [Pseudomonadales bacterium]MCP5171144.1 hypothetical protein [Pseudomonadales bacterium]MCP5301618.1 hypothetical protein [Pseudomonadales bacterium]
MYPDITTDIPALNVKHDNRHKLDGSELARESTAYMIEIPEENIGGFLYTWVNGLGKAGAAVTLFGAGVGDTPIFELCDDIPVPAEMDFYDWHVGGLHKQLKEPLKTASLTFKSERVKVEYHFEANHPAYAYSTHENGCPQWIANDRFEQQGRAHGKVEFDGRTIEFDGYGQRDHSWGTREWAVNQHWKWVHAQAGPNLSLHFWELFALGKSHLCGFVCKEGEMAQVVAVDTDFSCNKGLSPKSVSAKITDSKGRITDLSATAYHAFPFPVHELITLFECPLNLSIDGVDGGGWMEMMWPNDLIGYMKDKTID